MKKTTDSFYGHSETILAALANAAAKAGAATLDIGLQGNILQVHDDRPQVNASLLSWENDKADRGMLQLLAVSDKVLLLNATSCLVVDCRKFFGDEQYRLSLPSMINCQQNAAAGFHMIAVLKRSHAAESRLAADTFRKLTLFPLDIVWNGAHLRRNNAQTPQSSEEPLRASA